MAFQFSDVVIPFKAKVDDVIKGIASIKTSFEDLGKTVKKIEDFINGPVNKAGNNINALSFRMLRMLDRLSLLVVMSRNVKGALDGIFGASSLVSKGFESVSEGLMIFTSLAMTAKSNMQLLAFGAVGLAAAAILFAHQWGQAQKQFAESIDKVTLNGIKMQRTIDSFSESMKDLSKSASVFGDTWGELAANRLSTSRSAFESNTKQIRDLEEALVKLRLAAEKKREEEGLDEARRTLQTRRENAIRQNEIARNNPWIPTVPIPSMPQASRELNLLEEEAEQTARTIRALQAQVRDIERDASMLVLAEQTQKYTTQLRELQRALAEITTLNPKLEELAQNFQFFADFGVDVTEQQRIQGAKQRLDMTREILSGVILENAGASQLEAALQEKKRAGLTDDFENAELKRLLEGRTQRGVNQSDAVKAVQDAGDALMKAEAPQKFTKAFTVPFTAAIGDAVINGIMQGKKGAEILSDTLSNLLQNGLNEAMKQFQQGMIDVFKNIAGAGGELLGSALTMVVGVVAGVLGRKAQSNDTFERVKNQIESTQAVRGIVAGPTNVAIAAVGENLKRALSGVEARLDIMIQLMVRGNQGMIPFAGSVATP